MHELSLSRAIVNTVVKHAEGRPVSVVWLNVGRLRQVVPGTLDFYFQFVARGTVCEGARLEQKLIPARLRCAACEREWELNVPTFSCETCGPGEVSVVSGDELEIDSIEVEEDEQCIAPR
jgi:hydrogenase nickel incorporation protein HypA/HybF